MLRERRRHANFKPNRRLDAKSSRGMIYENEELRLRTTNIHAEVEKGHSDIKKLKKENDQLRREIWTLRDEYDKLEKLLRNQTGLMSHQDEDGGSDYSQSEDGSSDASYDDDQEEEYADERNYESNHDSKSNNSSQSSFKSKDRLHVNFDHLSIVSEENSDNHPDSAQLSKSHRDALEMASNVDNLAVLNDLQSMVPPLDYFENLPYDQMGPSIDAEPTFTLQDWISISPQLSYFENLPFETIGFSIDANGHIRKPNKPISQSIQQLITHHSAATSTDSTSSPKHFFSPIKKPMTPRTGPDLFVNNVLANENPFVFPTKPTAPEPIYATVDKNSGSLSPNAFQTGGNLEDLLQDIEALSQDIMLMQVQQDGHLQVCNDGCDRYDKPYKSEINLYLEYPDGNPVIKSIETSATNYSTLNSVDEKMSIASLPEPMKLLPNKLHYGSFEHFNAAYEPPTITPPPSFGTAIQQTDANGQSKPTTPASTKRSLFSKVHRKDKKSNKDKSKTDSSVSTSTQSNELQKDGNGMEPLKILRNESCSSVVSGKSIQKSNGKPDSTDTPDSKKKSRRVSLFFSDRKEKKEAEKEKKKEMEANTNLNALLSSRRMSLDALTAASVVNHSPTRRHSSQHRKLSQESIHVKRTNSGRSNSSVKKRTRSGTSESNHYMDGMDGPSDRGNSLASSRESSLSARSQRTRRISIVSHGGGKIPWCGCWGNGCV